MFEAGHTRYLDQFNGILKRNNLSHGDTNIQN